MTIQDRLQAVRERFLTKLPARIDQMREAHAEGDVEALYRLSHTLYGTAGSLGLSTVSSAACALERLSLRARSEGGLDDAMRAESAALIDSLEAATRSADDDS